MKKFAQPQEVARTGIVCCLVAILKYASESTKLGTKQLLMKGYSKLSALQYKEFNEAYEKSLNDDLACEKAYRVQVDQQRVQR